MTVEALLDGWGAEPSQRCAGRHLLAVQDTSKINFTITRGRSRGLGEIGKDSGRGVLPHAMLGVDAETGGAGQLVSLASLNMVLRWKVVVDRSMG